MKNIKYLLAVFISFSLFFSCKTMTRHSVSSKDNTFNVNIKNDSYFVIEIDNQNILPQESKEHYLPLHDSALYDGWTAVYTIPLNKHLFYKHKEKIKIIDNQKAVSIANPQKTPNESYIIINNNSNQPVQFTNGHGTIFPCYAEGQVNHLKPKIIYTITGNQAAVYGISKKEQIFISSDKNNYSIMDNTYFRNGFVYTYSFDGKRIIKEDEKPLIKIKEPLWTNVSANIYVSKIISGTNKEQFYIIGKEKNRDKHGNVYESVYISSKDSSGTEKWKCLFTENNCDTSFYNAIVMEDASILAVGTHTKDLHTGLIVLYSQNGILLQSEKIEDCVLIESAVKIDKNNYIFTGFNLQGALVILSLTIEKNTFNTYSIPLNENEAVSKVIPFYDELSKKLLLFCNLFDLETEQALLSIIYAVSEDSKIERISLQNMIKEISTVLLDSPGHFYLGGETIEREQSAAVVVHLDYINNKPTVFYMDSSPYSYISALHLNEKSHELIISGTLKASDAFGNEDSPFIKSLSTDLGKELWATVYQDKNYELLSSFIPCADYGFIAVFTQVNEEGIYTAPFFIACTNAIGAVSK